MFMKITAAKYALSLPPPSPQPTFPLSLPLSIFQSAGQTSASASGLGTAASMLYARYRSWTYKWAGTETGKSQLLVEAVLDCSFCQCWLLPDDFRCFGILGTNLGKVSLCCDKLFKCRGVHLIDWKGMPPPSSWASGPRRDRWNLARVLRIREEQGSTL